MEERGLRQKKVADRRQWSEGEGSLGMACRGDIHEKRGQPQKLKVYVAEKKITRESDRKESGTKKSKTGV